MSGLTEELLTFARSKLVPEALGLVPANLATMVSRVIRAEGTSGTTIRAEIDPDLYVRAEPEYLFRSVANTIRNAIRYAGAMAKSASRRKSKANTVVLSICDSGPGIPEDALERIFTPFYRPDISRIAEAAGQGSACRLSGAALKPVRVRSPAVIERRRVSKWRSRFTRHARQLSAKCSARSWTR